jgi:hypothetical protein
MRGHYDIDIIKGVALPAICEKMGIELRRDGKVHCPFHDENTPSCNIREDSFHCFGCGEKGDVIKFVQKYQEVSFPDALRWIAENFGVASTSREFLDPPKRRPRGESSPPKLRGDDVARQSLACLRMMSLPDDAPLWDYAAKRGWSRSVMRSMGNEGSLGTSELGDTLVFATPWGTKVRYELGYSKSCRWAAGRSRDCVWRMHRITTDNDMVHLFEGETDLIGAASALGHWRTDGLVAVPGASWIPSEYQSRYIGSHRVVRLCYDNDEAGARATKIVSEFFKRVPGCKVEVFDWGAVDGATDIGDLVVSMGKENFIKTFALNWRKV